MYVLLLSKEPKCSGQLSPNSEFPKIAKMNIQISRSTVILAMSICGKEGSYFNCC